MMRRLTLRSAICILLAAFWSSPAAAQDRIVESIFERWLTASGGRSAWEKARAFKVVGKVERPYAPESSSPFTAHWTAAGFFRLETRGKSTGLLVTAYDGKSGWRHSERLGSGPLNAQGTEERIVWDDLRLPLSAPSGDVRFLLLPDADFEGRFCRCLDRLAPKSAAERWYFDWQTGLLHARVRSAASDAPASTTIYSDYRDVRGGLRVPFEIATRVQGQSTIVKRNEVHPVAAADEMLFAAPPAATKTIAEIDAAFERHLFAIGGTEAARGIYSRVTVQTVRDETAGVEFEQTVSQRSPFLVLTESSMPGVGRTLQGFDGTTAWEYSDVEGYHELKGGERLSLLGGASLLGAVQLRARLPLGKTLPDGRIGPRTCIRLLLSPLTGPSGTFWFDRESGHLVRIEGTMPWGASGEVETRIDFADFRKVDGVVIPFSTTTAHGAFKSTARVLRVQHNLPLEPGAFRPRKNG